MSTRTLEKPDMQKLKQAQGHLRGVNHPAVQRIKCDIGRVIKEGESKKS